MFDKEATDRWVAARKSAEDRIGQWLDEDSGFVLPPLAERRWKMYRFSTLLLLFVTLILVGALLS